MQITSKAQIIDAVNSGKIKAIYSNAKTLWWCHDDPVGLAEAKAAGVTALEKTKERNVVYMERTVGDGNGYRQRAEAAMEKIMAMESIDPTGHVNIKTEGADKILRWIELRIVDIVNKLGEETPDAQALAESIFIKAHAKNCEGKAYANPQTYTYSSGQ